MRKVNRSVGVGVLALSALGVAGCNHKDGDSNAPPGSSRVASLGSDTTLPSVAIVSPASGLVFSGTLTVEATATDDGGAVVLAQLIANGVAQQSRNEGPFTFTWDTSALPEGPYELKVMAVDASGNLGSSAPVNVTLQHVVSSVTLDPPTTPTNQGNLFTTATVRLTGPAPAGGAVIALATTNAAVAAVPATLTVPEGESSRTFNVSSPLQTVATSVTLSASYRSVTRTAVLNVLASPNPTLRSLFVVAEVVGGTTPSLSVSLFAAALSPMVVFLTSDNANVSVPATVTIPTGATGATVPLTTLPVGARTLVTITGALASGIPKTVQTTLMSASPVPTSLTVAPSIIAVGQTATGTVNLSQPAPAGGSLVTLLASNLDSPQVPAVTMPATFTIPEGAQVGSFSISPTPFGGAFHVSIRAQLNGVTVFTMGIESLTILRTLPVGNASTVSGAPRCSAVGAFCDTGGLIDSRDGLFLAPEFGTPNTINSSCQDGSGGIGAPPNRGVYHFDQSLDRLNVSTLDGSALAAGKTVKIEATVWWAGRLDLYSAPNATSPVWTLILSRQITNPLIRPNVVTTTFTLPAGTLQAIRGNFGTPLNPPTPCAIDQSSVIDDHDDLVFATDNGGPPTNIAPVVNAGADQTITLPPVAILLGAVNDDGLPNPPAAFTTTWSQVSGPGTVTFANADTAVTTATFSIAGTYTLRLTASDGVFSTNDTLVVAVNVGGPANQAPVVNAGSDQTITLPGGADLAAAVTDDGRPNPPGAFTVAWSQISGPGVVAFASPTAPTTTATFSVPGTYTLRVSANDALLASSDDVVMIVNPVPNQAPTVDAGPDQDVFVTNGALLSGTASDDGLPNPPGALTVTWSQVGGPGTVVFGSATALATAAQFSAPGSYVLRLTVSDGALTSSDDMTVVVNLPPNQAPLVNAGLDQTTTLPATADLIGSVTDDGLPAPPAAFTATWSQVGGPGTVTFANTNALLTSATFSTAGTYTLRLTADDSALTTSDDLVVTVNAAPVNTAPVVGAGADQTITLPAAAALVGTATDDGLPLPGMLTTTWSKVSGPGTVTFANASALATSATFSSAGSYVLRLLVSDGALSATDSVAITVNAAPTLRLQYRAVAPAVGDNQIRASLNVVNGGATPIPLRDLKIRYWYTIDTQRPQTVQCDFAQIGCSRITGQFVTVSPARPGADRYLEVGFTNGAGNLAPGTQTGEIRGRVRKTDSSNYSEANDYSYTTGSGVPAPTTLVDWTRVTLYRNGVRIWGTEP